MAIFQGYLRQKLLAGIVDDLLGDTVVLNVEETGVDSRLPELSSKGLAALKVSRVEWCQIDDRNLLSSAIAWWDVQDISEDWSKGGAKLELGSSRLGVCHLECIHLNRRK